MNYIPGWDDLLKQRAIEKGTPDQYVVFATGGYIISPFDDESLTATATIGQRDKSGYLSQTRFCSPHFFPRKFTVTVKDVRVQIQILRSLTAALNDGTIAPGNIPRAVSSVRAWDAICDLLKTSGGAIDA